MKAKSYNYAAIDAMAYNARRYCAATSYNCSGARPMTTQELATVHSFTARNVAVCKRFGIVSDPLKRHVRAFRRRVSGFTRVVSAL